MEFEAGGRKFKISKIDAYRQFHIVRRVGPLLSELFPALASVQKVNVEGLSDEEKFQELSKVLSPIMVGFSKLSDADADYVLNQLLSSVEVHQPTFNSWARVANKDVIMMQDIELPILLQAAGRALMFNLSGFFDTLRRK